jgi:hypothetical protein
MKKHDGVIVSSIGYKRIDDKKKELHAIMHHYKCSDNQELIDSQFLVWDNKKNGFENVPKDVHNLNLETGSEVRVNLLIDYNSSCKKSNGLSRYILENMKRLGLQNETMHICATGIIGEKIDNSDNHEIASVEKIQEKLLSVIQLKADVFIFS